MNNRVKHKTSFLCLCAIVCLLHSCSEDMDKKSFIPETPDYSLNQDEITVPKEGGDFAVTVKSNLPWRAKTGTGWITLKNENGTGNSDFSFSVGRNRTLETRVGEIIVWVTSDDQKKVKIVQSPSESSDLVNHYYVKKNGANTNDGLSWASATTLSNALEIMAPGDYIHIAAGKYIPTNMISGGNQSADNTFEIHSNVTIIGGYPADASEGALSDPARNETILSGNKEFYHTVTVTAPIETGNKVTLQNLSIKDGFAGTSSAGTITINGAVYRRSYAGGLIIGKSTVDIIGCAISENESQQHAAGVYVFAGANVTFVRTDITNNKGILDATNGGGIFNESSTVYMIDCNIIGNTVQGVGGGIYTYSADTPTYLYLYNSTVAHNSTNVGPNTTRRGGGLYVREFSRVQIINSTFYANESGRGGGVSIYGAAGKEASVEMISCTVFNNYAINNAGGIEVLDNTMLKAYNTIISGNNAPSYPDIQSTANTFSNSYMAIGNQIYDSAGAVVAGHTFDPFTMLGNLADNGGNTQTCLLSVSSPAALLGMSRAVLDALALQYGIDPDIITKDQIGMSRSEKWVMGAVVPK